MQDYRKLAFAGFRHDDTEEDKEYVLAELIERNVPASAEVVSALLEQRREFKARAKLASQIASQVDSSRQMEIVQDLERQYPVMKAALERFGFTTEDMPAWANNRDPRSEIRDKLEPKVLVPAQNLVQPTLLLIPPYFSIGMVKQIDAHRLPNQKKCTYPGSWKGLLLSGFFAKCWDDKQAKSPLRWGIGIAEGQPHIPVPVDRLGENNYRFSQWREKIGAQGLDVMDSACAWLMLWINKIHQGECIDDECPNVLKETPYDLGECLDLVSVQSARNRIKFEVLSNNEAVTGLHARGIVWIVKPH